MIFEDDQRTVERARDELKRAAADADGWSDEKRRQFDTERLTPLDQAAQQFLAAVGRAQEAVQQAERLLGTDSAAHRTRG